MALAVELRSGVETKRAKRVGLGCGVLLHVENNM